MKCEVEFIAVGANSKAGDAIVIRYGEPHDYKLILVDGGHGETGERLVTHLRKEFGPRVALEHVLLTHSDADHASGLRTVLEQVPVRNMWLHVPWFLARDVVPLFDDSRWTQDGLERAIRKEYDIIGEIVDLAAATGAQLRYPFQGDYIGPFRILSPSRRAYLHLLPQFEKTPAPNEAAIKAASMWIGKASIMQKIIEATRAKVDSWITESWTSERLKDGGITSASNESSVVLYGTFDGGRRYLLTGDAGVNALTWSANYADATGLPLQNFTFVQIPHHGSRRNVGPSILTRLLGPVLAENSAGSFFAYVSAPKDDESHPRRIVLNAFKRRGGIIIATQGWNMLHMGGFPVRDGYGDVEALPFYTRVEAYT
ncbi:ComEC/Rec2 family competence protein [Bradyrhizobium sp. GCM10028915]|uniref:ComEC/Rec2 family competence protein n=1 Tax=Bradyrhizobium sp. GCM10028915 TaxID=3273385 RepID=UPI003607233F